MLELLAYLRANGFRTYIVSGGGVEMIRAFSEKVYGIPPEQVIGSTIATEYRVTDGMPAIIRLPKVDFVDDKAGKPVAIQKFIGRRPILAFGNSDGDFQMLEWTDLGPRSAPRADPPPRRRRPRVRATTGSPTSGDSTRRSTPRPRRAGRS